MATADDDPYEVGHYHEPVEAAMVDRMSIHAISDWLTTRAVPATFELETPLVRIEGFKVSSGYWIVLHADDRVEVLTDSAFRQRFSRER